MTLVMTVEVGAHGVEMGPVGQPLTGISSRVCRTFISTTVNISTWKLPSISYATPILYLVLVSVVNEMTSGFPPP